VAAAVAAQAEAGAVGVPVRAVERPRELTAGVVGGVDFAALLDANVQMGAGVTPGAVVLAMHDGAAVAERMHNRGHPFHNRRSVGRDGLTADALPVPTATRPAAASTVATVGILSCTITPCRRGPLPALVTASAARAPD
jgi:hypothetical protein